MKKEIKESPDASHGTPSLQFRALKIRTYQKILKKIGI
jgi:hypothetical protein